MSGTHRDSLQLPLPHDRDPIEMGWATGFLEGEGTFGHRSNRRVYARIVAEQNDSEPLYRLQRILGGRVYQGNTRSIFIWDVSGDRARAIIRLLYPRLSARRREQIDRIDTESRRRN